MDKKETNEVNSYLSFRLGEEIFALDVVQVHKILGMTSITEVPKSPDYMKGVINLRGSVLPVVDTRIKFGMSPIEETKSTSILVVETELDEETVMMGLIVDAVHSVLKLDAEDLLAPPRIGNHYQSEFISNMARVKDKFFIVLNLNAVFSTKEHLDIKEFTAVSNAATKENCLSQSKGK